MAGKRQHYVPRLLQRGFLHDPTDRAERTWLHRRNAQPRLVGIRDVGVEEHFYSHPSADGSRTLDDLITDLEGDLEGDLRVIRGVEVGRPVDAKVAARVVVHLVTRTAHIRALFAQVMTSFLDEAAARFTNPVRLRAILGLDRVKPSSIFREVLDETLDTAPLDQLGIPRELAGRMLLFMARENADLLLAQQAELIQPVFARLAEDVSGRIRDAHKKALGDTPKDNAWIGELSTYEWRIERIAGAILSDSVALVFENNAGFVPFLLATQPAAEGVVLPLNQDRLLVGRRSAGALVDLDRYNEGAAACSDNFFISAGRADGKQLVDLIGARPTDAIGKLVGDTFFAFEGEEIKDPAAECEAEFTVPFPATSSSSSFSVRYEGFADEALASEIGGVVKAVVEELARKLPLHELDGLTFATDYSEALRKLDRGSDTLAPAESSALSYGQGVAKSVEVIRDGQHKTHLVMQAGIALGLISPDLEQRRISTRLLVQMLAGVAHAVLYERTLGQPTPPDAIARHLHGAVAAAPTMYFSARESAFVAPDMGNIYAELVMKSLAHAKAEILKARLSYRTSGDLEQLLAIALRCVAAMLGHTADWLGHRDGLAEGADFHGNDLPERLQGEGLAAWLELFGRDLRAIYEVQSGQLDPERLYLLDRHVERLLWLFQICPWPTSDGEVLFSVPFGNDLTLLEGGSRETEVR